MSEKLMELSCTAFTEQLASKAPVPGGGGAAALTGSLAASLGAMAVNLTRGKKKYLSFDEDHRRIAEETEVLRRRFLELAEEDAAAFEPLSRVYSMDRDDPAYPDAMRRATEAAWKAPLEMMHCCCTLTVLLEELYEKCSALLLSDVGCAALTVCAALEAASLNVFVNTRTLPGSRNAEETADEAEEMLREYAPRARALADAVMTRLRNGTVQP